MRRLVLLFFATMSTFLFQACLPEESPDVGPNNSPAHFLVNSVTVNETEVTLSWYPANDPDGDKMTYDLYLNDNVVETRFVDTTYTLNQLQPGTTYVFKVYAQDGRGGSSLGGLMFTTDKEVVLPFVLETSKLAQENFVTEVKVVDCLLENGITTKCYELSFKSNTVLGGPYCEFNAHQSGGMVIYDGSDPGMHVIGRSFFDLMESDGYDILDPNGALRVSNSVEANSENHKYCIEPLANQLKLTFWIPAMPYPLETRSTIGTGELLGITRGGIPIMGDPHSVKRSPYGEGNVSPLDACGGHHDAIGFYHYHFIPQCINEVLENQGVSLIACNVVKQDNQALVGYAKDGFPIYASREPNGVLPNDLDQCSGHFGATPSHPEGEYHYHATLEAPNIPPCLVGASPVRSFRVSLQ